MLSSVDTNAAHGSKCKQGGFGSEVTGQPWAGGGGILYQMGGGPLRGYLLE